FVPGIGDGTFAKAISISNLVSVNKVVAADLNLDHKSDIIFTQFNYDQIYTMLGNGDGTFQAAQTTPVQGLELSTPVAADFNNDGQADVAITDWPKDTLLILLGNGDGTFQPAIKIHPGDGPQYVTVADFNLDHNLDVVVSNIFGGTIGVCLGH